MWWDAALALALTSAPCLPRGSEHPHSPTASLERNGWEHLKSVALGPDGLKLKLPGASGHGGQLGSSA